MDGFWPKDSVQRAFVEGAKWWQFHHAGSTMFGSERDVAEAEAVKRYGELEVAGTPTLPLEGKAQDTLAEIFEPTIPMSVEYFLNERMGAMIKQLDQEIVADFGAAMRADFEGSPSRTYDGILRMEESKHDVEAGGAAGEDRRTVEAISKSNDGVESGAVGVGEQKGVEG